MSQITSHPTATFLCSTSASFSFKRSHLHTYPSSFPFSLYLCLSVFVVCVTSETLFLWEGGCKQFSLIHPFIPSFSNLYIKSSFICTLVPPSWQTCVGTAQTTSPRQWQGRRTSDSSQRPARPTPLAATAAASWPWAARRRCSRPLTCPTWPTLKW